MADIRDTDNGWIQTFSGNQFWPLSPRTEDVLLVDIAHALAMKCRFSGHCREFYSVAQHSVMGSRQANDPELSKWFLLHDAAEAYLFDAARPVKLRVPVIKEIENQIMKCVAERYGLPWPEPSDVKEIDNRMLMTERRDLLAIPPRPWTIRAKSYPFRIDPWSWEEAKYEFLYEAKRLGVCDESPSSNI
jgi:hypothetical protein